MTIDKKIRDEKLRYGIDREAAKISALSSGKIEKYECLRSEEIVRSGSSQTMQQAKFIYFPLGKPFDQGDKQLKSLKVLKHAKQNLANKDATPEDQLNEEAQNEIENIRKSRKK